MTHQRAQREPALAWSEVALQVLAGAEGHRADGVPLLERDVGQQHDRVEHLVEVRRAGGRLAIVGAQPPAAVDEEHHALIALVLELTHDGLGEPRRGAPVDEAHRVADPVLRELLEIGALPAQVTWHAEWIVQQRTHSAMAYDIARDRVVLFGGEDLTGLLSDTWEWDGFDWRRVPTDTAPPARAATARGALRRHPGGAFRRLHLQPRHPHAHEER